MKRQITVLIAIVVIAVVAVGAYVVIQQAAAPTTPKPTYTSTTTPTQTTTTPATPYKVAVIFPGPITDASWNMLGYQALVKLKNELNIDFAYSESLTALPDASRAARKYAIAGYDLVIGHSGSYTGILIEISKDFPKTTFVVQADLKPENIPKNVGAFFYNAHEPYYLIGYLAGKMTKTNKIGVIGGSKIPYMIEWVNALELAAKKANPNVTVTKTFLGSFNDPVLAKETALTQIGTGADVISFQQNEGAKGIIEAVKEKTVYAFGHHYDMNAFAPTLILTSMISNVEQIFRMVITSAKAGTFAGKMNYYSIRDGATDIAPFYGLISKSLDAEIMQLRQDIIQNKLTVPRIATL